MAPTGRPTRAEASREALRAEKRERHNLSARKYRANVKTRKLETQAQVEQAILEQANTAEYAVCERQMRRKVKNIYDNHFANANVAEQARILCGLLRHPLLQPACEVAGIESKKERDAASAIIGNLRESVQALGKDRSKDHLAARGAIVKAVVDTTGLRTQRLQSMAAQLLGVRAKLIRAAGVRKLAMEGDPKALWALTGKARRCDALSPETRAIVEAYWEEHTRVCPDRKKIVNKRVGRGLRISAPTHYLEESQTSFYMTFVQRHPEVVIGQRTFEMCKPFFVRRLQELNTCCCRYHVEMDCLYEGFRKLRKTHVEQCECACQTCLRVDTPTEDAWSCHALDTCPPELHKFISNIMCPKAEGGEYYRRDCIEGACSECGALKLFPTCTTDLISTQTIQWKRFRDIQTPRPDGGISRRPILSNESTTPLEFLNYMHATLPKYIQHRHRQRWLASHFNECRETFPHDVIVSVLDFAENYTFQHQNEIQSEHWFNIQVTILVHITYRHAKLHLDGVESTDEDRQIIKECHFYISDDKNHDTLFVQHCFDLHHKWLTERHVHFDRHWIWSDGCSGMP